MKRKKKLEEKKNEKELQKSVFCPKCKHGKPTWTPIVHVASIPLISIFPSDLEKINDLLEKANSNVLLIEDYDDVDNPKLTAYERWVEVECRKCGTRFLLDCGPSAMSKRSFSAS